MSSVTIRQIFAVNNKLYGRQDKAVYNASSAFLDLDFWIPDVPFCVPSPAMVGKICEEAGSVIICMKDVVDYAVTLLVQQLLPAALTESVQSSQ